MADRYWVGGTGTWSTSSTTNWSTTSGGASGASAPTSADNVFIDGNSNTGTSNFTISCSGVVSCNDLTISGLDGGLSMFTSAANIFVYGNFSIPSSNISAWSVGVYFQSTGSVSINFGSSVTANIGFGPSSGAAGTYTLTNNLTTTASVTYYNGTLNLNDYTITCRDIVATAANTRTLAFGTSGSIVTTGISNSGTLRSIDIIGTTLTVTGTSLITSTYTGADKIIRVVTNMTESNAINVSTTLTSSFATTIVSNSVFSNLTTTGTGTLTLSGGATIYKNLTLGSGATVSGSSAVSFSSTSGTRTITTNGVTLPFPMSFPAIGATYSLADNLTASDTLSIAGAAFSVNGKVLTVSSTLTLSSGSLSIGSGSISGYTMAHSGGTVNLNTGTLTLTTSFSQTGGTLNFNSGSITCGTWSSSGTRTIDWNTTGTVYVTGSSISHSATNLTTTNAPGVFSHSGSSLGTLNIGTFTESTAPNLTAQGNTTWSASPTQTVKNFTHLPVGTISGGSPTVYGDLTLSYGTLSSGSVITLAATSGTKTITTNGGSLYSLVISGPGATYNLVGDITFYSFQLSQGTFSAGSYNITATSFTNSSSSTRTLNMGSGTWSIGGDWNPNATGLTFSAQTSTINLTSTSSINFVGGGRTYYNLNKADTGSLTISGSNTFNAISSSATGAATISFTAGTTQTVSGFTASGTAGNLLTLQSTTSGSKWYLSKSSGTVSVGYLSISDCTVNPGANWYAGRNSTNGGNNLGWYFSDPYVVAGQFLDVISFSDE